MRPSQALLLSFVIIFWASVVFLEIWAAVQWPQYLNKHHFTVSTAIARAPQSWVAIPLFAVIAGVFGGLNWCLWKQEARVGTPVFGLASAVAVLLVAISAVSYLYNNLAHSLIAGTFFLTVVAYTATVEATAPGLRFAVPRRAMLAFLAASVVALVVVAVVAKDDIFGAGAEVPGTSTALGVLEFVFGLFWMLYLVLVFH